jgi:RHS repeat-associated protein
VTHTYWSDRWKPLEERIGSSTTASRSYLWGERPGHRDDLVLRDRDTNGDGSLDERLYATMDYFNGTAVLNASGAVLERYAYSAFGERRITAADFSPRSTSSYAWDFGFQGQFRDAETGWYNYGYRFYVPELGRWINRDPIGERGGEYLYVISSNNVINRADYLGLSPFGPRYPVQNSRTECGITAAFPNAMKSGAEGSFRPSPANMTNPRPLDTDPPDTPTGAGCRAVTSPDECTKVHPNCERHVIVYTPFGDTWDGPRLPNYHAIGQETCNGGYIHQVGGRGPVHGPFDDPDKKARAYFDSLGEDRFLIENHYCCPNDQ